MIVVVALVAFYVFLAPLAVWLILRNRLQRIEARMQALELAPREIHPAQAAERTWSTVAPPIQERPPAAPEPLGEPLYAPVYAPPQAAPPLPSWGYREAAAPARRSSEEWESLVGGNWLNKLGVTILVIGLALALGYSFTHLGAGGRIGVSLAVAVAMLSGGAALETRERYRIFARGLIGGGWAALYFTVYAMHAVPAARILENSWVAAVLLLVVSAGMIVHSLRYRSATVSGLAYFVAFLTVAVTDVNTLAIAALLPLAASVLYLARRFGWPRLALFGLAATYLACLARGNSGAPLWQAQAVFTFLWLLFEGFDLLVPQPLTAPLNAAGFFALSVLKWQDASPRTLWVLFAAAAAAYIAGAALRLRAGRWRFSGAVAAGLAAVAILLKLEGQSVTLALLLESELVYLAGVRSGSGFLRRVAAPLFAVELTCLIVGPHQGWTLAAALSTAVLYLNRILYPRDVVCGYAGAAILAWLAGHHAPRHDSALLWMLAAAPLFAIGRVWQLPDFRYQAYGMGALAAVGVAVRWPEPALSLAAMAALAYAGQLASPRDTHPRRVLSLFGGILIAALLYQRVSGSLLTVAWGIQGVVLLAAGFPLRDRVLRLSGLALLWFCTLKLFVYDLSFLETLPRILSFLALGAILVGVSWIYTRFREHVRRYL
jgi:uncharacterized membrane protein